MLGCGVNRGMVIFETNHIIIDIKYSDNGIRIRKLIEEFY